MTESVNSRKVSFCRVVLQLFQFNVNGEWWTWIDYDKFHELMRQYYLSNGTSTFTAEVSNYCMLHVRCPPVLVHLGKCEGTPCSLFCYSIDRMVLGLVMS